MNEFQKIIKYLAIAFGLYLAVSIIAAIASIVISICTGIYGFNVLTSRFDTNIVDGTKQFENFSRLDLDIASSSLTIKASGNEYKVETANVPNSMKIENNNGTLKIDDKKKITSKVNNSSVIIYIPEGTELDEIDLDMGAGNVNIEDIKSKKNDFDFGAGSVNIKKLISSNADIDCGAGQVIIENSDLSNADINSGVGKLSFSGYLRNTAKLECGVGEVNLDLEGGAESYLVRTEKGIGNITINGDSIQNNTTTGNGNNKIEIEGGIGKIEIKM